jgi:hypothetical protein
LIDGANWLCANGVKNSNVGPGVMPGPNAFAGLGVAARRAVGGGATAARVRRAAGPAQPADHGAIAAVAADGGVIAGGDGAAAVATVAAGGARAAVAAVPACREDGVGAWPYGALRLGEPAEAAVAAVTGPG